MKERTTVSLDSAVLDAVPEDVNFSDEVNRFARRSFIEGKDYAVSRGKLDTVRDVIAEIRAEADAHRERAARLDDIATTLDALAADLSDEVEAAEGEVPPDAPSVTDLVDMWTDDLASGVFWTGPERTTESKAIQLQAERRHQSPAALLDEIASELAVRRGKSTEPDGATQGA